MLPSPFMESKDKFLSPDEVSTFVASTLRDELLREEMSPKREHRSLSPEIQSIVKSAVIRMAGCGIDGTFQGNDQLLRDLRTVVLIEEDLVIDPVEVEGQMKRYKAARESGSDDSMQSLQKVSAFAALGGHANLNEVSTLLEVLKRRGYVCLLEYTVDGVKVPGGYIYGFSESFEDDSRFRTLGINTILAPEEKKRNLLNNVGHIVTQWRTGVPLTWQHLKSRGIEIPERLTDAGDNQNLQSPRQWGGGNAMKLGVASMGKKQDKTILLLNVGTIEEIDLLLGQKILNVASYKYNEAFVLPSGYARDTLDKVSIVSDGIRRHIANIRWEVFAGLIADAIAKLKNPDGVLRRKGGWDIDQIYNFGQVIGGIDPEKIRQAAESTTCTTTSESNDHLHDDALPPT